MPPPMASAAEENWRLGGKPNPHSLQPNPPPFMSISNYPGAEGLENLTCKCIEKQAVPEKPDRKIKQSRAK